MSAELEKVGVECEFFRKYTHSDGDRLYRCLEGCCLNPRLPKDKAKEWGQCCALCPSEYADPCDLKCDYAGSKRITIKGVIEC